MDRLKTLSRSSQLLLGAGALLFIFLFFDWQQVSLGPLGSAGRSGWHGWGTAAGIVVIVLLAWEAAQVLAVKIDVPVKPALLSAGLAAAVLLFTVLKFLVDNEARHWPAWLGLILALAIGAGGYLRYSGDAANEVSLSGFPSTPSQEE